MGRIHRNMAVLATTITAAALGAFAAASVGDDGKAELADRVAASKEPLERLATREIGAATAARLGATTAARRRRLRVRYFVGEGVVPAGDFEGGILSCPRRVPKALGGGFDSPSTRVLLSTNRPDGSSGRDWAVGVTNLGDSAQPFIAVIVCAKV